MLVDTLPHATRQRLPIYLHSHQLVIRCWEVFWSALGPTLTLILVRVLQASSKCEGLFKRAQSGSGLQYQGFMNMFMECHQPLFNRELEQVEDTVSCQRTELNGCSWNVFGKEEPELVDCSDIPDRKSTGLELQEQWDESVMCNFNFQREAQKVSRQSKSSKNETKNIPKNYGKATILYIKSNVQYTKRILKVLDISMDDFNRFIDNSKMHINTIKDIRNLWTHETYGKPIRILSYQFMRKHSLNYIFNSRIKNHITHVKYRNKLMDGLKNPVGFNNIKDF